MKKKIFIFLLAAAIAGGTVTAAVKFKSSSNEKSKDQEFSSVLNEVNSSRSAIRSNPASLKNTDLNWFSDDKDAFSEKEITEISKYALDNKSDKYTFTPTYKVNYDDSKSITNKEAKDDVNQLFKLLKYCYGPYGYYGGDKAFNAAQDKILSDINSNKEIKVSNFIDVIKKNLQFITDGHFNIYGSNKFTENSFQHSFYNYMGSDDFYKDKDGWYTISGKDKLYVKEIDKSNNINSYMYHSINDKGQLIYKLSVLKDENASYSINLNVKYSKNGSDVDKTIKLEKVQPLMPDNTSVFKYYSKDGIPVSKLTSFIKYTANDNDQQSFSNSALDMKKSPVSIIDLRGNFGGDASGEIDWIKNYIGRINISDYQFEREGYMQLSSTPLNKIFEGAGYSPQTKSPFTVISPGRKANTLKNDKLLIVLVDKYSSSASEHFITELTSMNNVLIVGTNTAGCYLSAVPILYGLHNSNIPIEIPNCLFISPLSNDYEGKGMKPDILVNSKDALDKVVKMVQYYNLNKK